MRYGIYLVPQNETPMYWPKVKGHIQRVVDSTKGELTVASVKHRVINGECGLVVVSRGTEIVAAMTVETHVCESYLRILLVPVIGGDELEGWAEQFVDFLRGLRDAWGCDLIRGGGRPGWVRYLKQFGWTESHRMVDLEV